VSAIDYSQVYQPATHPEKHQGKGNAMPSNRQKYNWAAACGWIILGFMGAAPIWAETLPIGSTAPPFRLPATDGKTYALNDYSSAKILVIVFTCNHCPTAQAYEDRIIQLVKDFKGKGVAFVAISPNDPQALRLDELGYTDLGDSLDDMKIRARDKAFNFPYLFDGNRQEVSRAYGPAATPHVFIFDRERCLRFTGRIDNSEKINRVTSQDTRLALEALLAGKKPPVETTRTFGCSVKWSDKRDSAQRSLEQWDREEVSLKEIGLEEVAKMVKNNTKKLRLINVWATWCGPCVAELPDLVTVNRMYRHRDFDLITIAANAPAEKDQVLETLKKKRVAARNYLFAGQDRYKLMETIDPKSTGALPHTLLVAPGGKILYRKSEPFDPLEVKKAIVGFLGRVYK
jgi:peroxiredoxin